MCNSSLCGTWRLCFPILESLTLRSPQFPSFVNQRSSSLVTRNSLKTFLAASLGGKSPEPRERGLTFKKGQRLRGWGCVQGSGQRGHLGVLPTLRWWCVQGHVQSPAFAPGCLEMAVGVSRSLCIFCPGFALPCACVQLFLILYTFFVACCLSRGVSKGKHCSIAVKSLRFQPI